MNEPHCAICIETLPMDRFRLLKCGHAFCETCLSGYLATSSSASRPCPQCRKPIYRSDLRPIFLTFSASSTVSSTSGPAEDEDESMRKAREVAEKLSRMDDRSKPKTIERASRELEKIAKAVSPGGESNDVAQSLIWDAVHAFEQRIAPNLTEVAFLRKERSRLQAEVQTLERDCQRMSLRAKSLERKAEQAVSAAEAAVASLQSLNKDYADFQAKAAKIAASEAAAVEKYERLAESSHKWQSLIRAHKDKELKQKKKIQALKKDNEDKNRLIEELLRKLPSQYSSYPSQHDRDIEGESDLDHSPAFSEDEGDEAASLIVDLDSVPTTPAPQRTFRQPLSPLVAESRPNRTSETRPQPPRFRSDWQLRQPEPKRRKANPEQPFNFPIDVDGKGRAKKTVRCGTKRKLTCA